MTPGTPQRGTALVVGGRGTIGSAVADVLRGQGCHVLVTSRTPGPDTIELDPASPESQRRAVVAALPELDVVVWAQGTNANDRLGELDLRRTREVLDGNLGLVAETLDALVATGRLRRGARLVVISSVWEIVARPGKFAYTVSKAALGGLVRAAALDLAPHDVLVNAVLPGVVDTAMTRSMLSREQLARVETATGFGRLVPLDAVTSIVGFLCSAANTGITGQSIAVDLGFSVARPV